jgi:hypothetical protein
LQPNHLVAHVSSRSVFDCGRIKAQNLLPDHFYVTECTATSQPGGRKGDLDNEFYKYKIHQDHNNTKRAGHKDVDESNVTAAMDSNMGQ